MHVCVSVCVLSVVTTVPQIQLVHSYSSLLINLVPHHISLVQRPAAVHYTPGHQAVGMSRFMHNLIFMA